MLRVILSVSHPCSSVNPEAALNQSGIFISIVLADQGTFLLFFAAVNFAHCETSDFPPKFDSFDQGR